MKNFKFNPNQTTAIIAGLFLLTSFEAKAVIGGVLPPVHIESMSVAESSTTLNTTFNEN
ncbi:MAG: hypothetical protein Q8861_06350 [Bacteroidota bacterium]|nr:hypothetical protein [Bacteroidota bacterium]